MRTVPSELPFAEALAVADSALRHGGVTLEAIAATLRADTPARVRRVLEHASGLAANPFESVLRAVLIEAGIEMIPQWETRVGGVAYHPDLADPLAGIAVEADSWSHHAGRADHDADCARYNALVVCGWTVLRFTWEQVMFSPQAVVATVRAAYALPRAA